MAEPALFKNFEEFYPFYLKEHSQRWTRILHFAGTSLALGFAAVALLNRNPLWLGASLASGYTPAWIAHFFVEKNQPATFRHPLYSFRADFRLFFDLLAGRQSF